MTNLNKREFLRLLGTGSLAGALGNQETIQGETPPVITASFAVAQTISSMLHLRVPSGPVLVLGYYAPGDGGGGIFVWNSTSMAPPDGGMIFVSNNSPTGRWLRDVDEGYVSVKWFGAKGDGVSNDGPFIQNAINYATGYQDPTTHSREPIAGVYLPASFYNIAAAAGSPGLLIRSVQGFHLFGDGTDISVLQVGSGLNLDSLIEIDGSANGIYENFSLTSASNGFADKMLYLHWNPTLAHRSTTNNRFQNVNVGGVYRTAFAVGTDDGSFQCDGTIFEQCVVTGYWPGSASGLYEYGWEIGSGINGNNLHHTLSASSWAGVQTGVYMNAAEASIFNAQPGGAQTDILISGPRSPIVIDNLRSEASNVLLDHGGGQADAHLSMRGVQWNAENLASDGKWIKWHTAGVLVLQDVTCLNPPTGVQPVIDIDVPDSSGYSNASVIAQGVASNSSVDAAFHLGLYNNYLTIINYHQQDVNDIPIAVTPLRILGPG